MKQLFYGYMFIGIHIYLIQENQVFKDAYNFPKTSPWKNFLSNKRMRI